MSVIGIIPINMDLSFFVDDSQWGDARFEKESRLKSGEIIEARLTFTPLFGSGAYASQDYQPSMLKLPSRAPGEAHE